jgi:hypothetical protein
VANPVTKYSITGPGNLPMEASMLAPLPA